MKNIPLIIPVFNQLTYLKNLINWWRWYYPENPIYIVDNGSTYPPLIKYLDECVKTGDVSFLLRFKENSFISNLSVFIEAEISPRYEYYVLSDPDIYPHPSTPGNFLEVWKDLIDNHGYHRAGFGLITEGITAHNKQEIINNESGFRVDPVFEYKGFKGYRAPIDTTFCLYKTANGGWSAPMNGQDWGNCMRLFEAFHLPWHLDEENLNEEMKFYFSNVKKHVPGQVSAGRTYGIQQIYLVNGAV